MTLEIVDNDQPKPRKGYLRFKCRSCGALEKVHGNDPKHFFQMLTPVRLISYHSCDEDRMGITDLIGCTFEDAE